MHSFSINASSGTQPYGNLSRSVQAAAALWNSACMEGAAALPVQRGIHSLVSPAAAGRLTLLKLYNLHWKKKIILGLRGFVCLVSFLCCFSSPEK